MFPKRNNTNRKGLYAILDTLANDIPAQVIHMVPLEAPAVRLFADAVLAKGSQIAQHPTDYVLVRLGYITDGNVLEPDHKVIITAAAILAAAQANQEGQK